MSQPTVTFTGSSLVTISVLKPTVTFTKGTMGGNMIVQSEKAVENSTYAVVIAFKNSAGADVAPNSLTWTLSDKGGTVVNSREDVEVSTPAASTTIVLSGDDLALPDADDCLRFLTVEGDYDDPLGSGLPIRAETAFEITNTVN